MRALPCVLAFCAVACLAACAVGPDYRRPELSLTESYAGAPVLADGVTSQRWWTAFDDETLDRLVDRALSENLDLAQVAARLDQARAAARHAGATLLPAVDATATGERVHGSMQSPLGAIADAVGAPRNYSDTAVGLAASWEADLFGGLGRAHESARARERAAVATVAATRVAVAAETADAYLTLRGLQGRLAVADHQEQSQTTLVELIRRRFDEGLASERELQRAIGALEGVRASIPPLHAAIDAQIHRLDVLTGAQAGTHRAELRLAAAVPAALRPTGSAVPGELLRRRPDVVAAEQRLVAANADIGVALAEYYPRLSVTALLGFASLGTGELFHGDAAEARAIAGLHWRLFDFGRVDAEVAAARGREAEALAAYRSSLLHATEDVETALSRQSQAQVATAILERQVAALAKARDQTQLAYASGVVALIDVLDADRELLGASDRLVVAQTEVARASIAVVRALGGGWSS